MDKTNEKIKKNELDVKINKIKKDKFGLANWLTVIRLLLMIPFIVIMSVMFILKTKTGAFFYYGVEKTGDTLSVTFGGKNNVGYSILYWINCLLFIIAMITDFIDGHYARKHKTVSVFGKIFDPIADKVATTLMFLFLAIMEFTYLPLIILFIMRDILVDGSRMYASKKNIKIAANVWGKIKTIFVSISIIVIAFAAPWLYNKNNKEFDTWKIFYINIPLIASLILAWVSGIIYINKYLKGITKDMFSLEEQEAKKVLSDVTVEKTNVTVIHKFEGGTQSNNEITKLNEQNLKNIKLQDNVQEQEDFKQIENDNQEEPSDKTQQIDFSKTEIFK